MPQAQCSMTFIQAGMCDEVSVVVAAAADGSSETLALFSNKGGFVSDTPVGFDLKEAKVMDGGSVWLRYTIKK